MKTSRVVVVLVILLVIAPIWLGGCAKNPRRPFPEINASFPVPEGKVVGEIKGEFFDIVLTNEYDYFPQTADYMGGDDAVLSLTGTTKEGRRYHRSWAVASPMFVRGDATAKYPIVDFDPLTFLVPDKTNPKYNQIVPEALMLTESVKWVNKDKGFSFDVPVKIWLKWRTPRE